MDIELLQFLLIQPESANLEFKRRLYTLDTGDSMAKKRQRGELIKDILALPNGSPTTVGDKAYLIIGADDKLQADGTRQLFDVAPKALTKQRILHLVNAACQPRLQDIEYEPVEFTGKRLLVITIWPTPHLHETTRDLTTSQGSFSKHTVFTRHDENIDIATQRERETILKLKQVHFTDFRNVSPVAFGAFVGAITGGLMAGSSAFKDNTTPPSRSEVVNLVLAGSMISTSVGVFIGWFYREFLDTKYEWYFRSGRERFMLLSATLGLMIILWNRLQTIIIKRR